MRHRFDFAQTGTWLVAALFLFLGVLQLPAASTTLNYQGRVIANGVAFQGTGQFKFALISSDGSTYYWKNDGSTGATDPASAVSLAVNRGLFSIRLGDTAIPNMTALDSAVLANAGVKLRVWFNDGVKGFQQMNPDQSLRQMNETSTETSTGIYSAPGLNDSNGYLAFITSGNWSRIAQSSIRGGYAMFIRDNDTIYCTCRNSSGKYQVARFDLETMQIERICEFSFTPKKPGVQNNRFKSGAVISNILWLDFYSSYDTATPNSSFVAHELVAIDLVTKNVLSTSTLNKPSIESLKTYCPLSVTINSEVFTFSITNSDGTPDIGSAILTLKQGDVDKNIKNSGINTTVSSINYQFPNACAFEYGGNLFLLSGPGYWLKCPTASLRNLFIKK
jgi:hypothetical protein